MQGLSLQDTILTLSHFWSNYGCVLPQTYDMEMGAGTSSPLTALNALGKKPWNIAFVQPCRRPGDGRYGENPNRFQKFFQFQVMLKPCPENPQELLLQSYEALGLHPKNHDIRFVKDDWENPSLGAAGLGWEVWCDGMEVTQYTYFQQMGGLPCNPPCVELAYGVERLTMILQNKENAMDILWNNHGVTYRDMVLLGEQQFCRWYRNEGNEDIIAKHFQDVLDEGHHLEKLDLVLPAFECCIKANHLFNQWDALGALGPSQRAQCIASIRSLASSCAQNWVSKEYS